MENALWFAFGFIVARIVANVLILVNGYIALKQAEFDCLRILGTAAESTAYLQETRMRLIEDSEVPNEIKNQLKVQSNIDEHVYRTWKKTSIENLILMYPARYRRSLRFSDWPTAMSHLIELYKNPNKRN